MGSDDKDSLAAAAGLTELATVGDSLSQPAIRNLKRKRAITPSATAIDEEKQRLLDENSHAKAARDEKQQGSFLYLAYGSNLSASTFLGVRGIKPLRAVNVHVPSLELTFDLPGIAYTEPCFANTRQRREPKQSEYHDEARSGYRNQANLGWSKGLVGVVYEVTAADYKHIIETEGGGAGYSDVQVSGYLLPKDCQEVPDPGSYPDGHDPLLHIPEDDQLSRPFLVHTLLAASPTGNSHLVRQAGWAQPSPRYLGLLRTGSKEHSLPDEYSQWLDTLQPYEKTTFRQRIGGAIFIGVLGPILFASVKIGEKMADKNGIIPAWYSKIMMMIFGFLWFMYDTIFYTLAGDGERTECT